MKYHSFTKAEEERFLRERHLRSECVYLNPYEWAKYGKHGRKMEYRSRVQGCKEADGCDFSPIQSLNFRMMGMVCEGAVRKALGLSPELPMDAFGQEDAPGGIQVRLISKEFDGLKIRKSDYLHYLVIGVLIPIIWMPENEKNEIATFLATMQSILARGFIQIIGWYGCEEARDIAGHQAPGQPIIRTDVPPPIYPEWYEDFRKNRPSVLTVPQSFLRPMDACRVVLADRGIVTTKDNLIYPHS